MSISRGTLDASKLSVDPSSTAKPPAFQHASELTKENSIMDTICEACRSIDFGKLLQVPPKEIIAVEGALLTCTVALETDPGLLLEQDTRRFADPESFSCPLCHLLSATLCPCEDEWSIPSDRDYAATQPYNLQALSFIRNCIWTHGQVDIENDCHILLAIRGMSSSWGDYSKFVNGESGYVVCLPRERQEKQPVPRVIPDRFDVQKAISWLQSCKSNHAAPCTEDVTIIPGMRVIDCETLKIVEAESGMIWVALSYVWGNAKSDPDSKDSEALAFPRHMSRTISDAIKVTQDMGYRYLWIDRYCIEQEDGDHKSSQIEQMDAIYRGADLTIIAAAGQDENHGLPGVGPTRHKKQQIVDLESCTILGTGPDPSYETRQSRWASRGWTFQEGLLSRRRLYFTDHQSWFECGKACWMEALGGPEPRESSGGIYNTAGIKASIHGHLSSYHKIQMATAENYDPARADSDGYFGEYLRFIREYAQRGLTFDSDSLAAFAGVSHHLQSTGPQVSHVLGIPYIPSLLGLSVARNYLVHLLCWFHSRDSVPRRRPQFPSWTWAGWVGEVSWMSGLWLKDSETIPKIRHIQFHDHGKAVPFEAYLRAWIPNKPQLTERNIALCFEARMVPPSLFSLYQDTGKWDETGSDNSEGDYYQVESVAFDEDGNIIDQWEEEPVHRDKIKSEWSRNIEVVRNYDTTDMEDWRNWRIGKHKLCERSRPPEFSPVQLVEQLQNGQWGCFLLGDYDGNGGFDHRRFLLVVEWLADGTAHRIGSVVLRVYPYLDQGAKQFFDDEDLSWKSVHLL